MADGQKPRAFGGARLPVNKPPAPVATDQATVSPTPTPTEPPVPPVPAEDAAPTPEPVKDPTIEARRIRHEQRMRRPPQAITEKELLGPLVLMNIHVTPGRMYRIANGPARYTWKWWSRLFNQDPVDVKIEGTFKDVVGVEFSHPQVNSHYLVQQFNERRRDVSRGHPIHGDDDLYIARIIGKRVVVHASELEEIPGLPA